MRRESIDPTGWESLDEDHNCWREARGEIVKGEERAEMAETCIKALRTRCYLHLC